MVSIFGFEVKITVSSAYNMICVCSHMLGMSLMYIMNNSGPSMLPWGTPVGDGSGVDVAWPILTTWVLSERYEESIVRAEGER